MKIWLEYHIFYFFKWQHTFVLYRHGLLKASVKIIDIDKHKQLHTSNDWIKPSGAEIRIFRDN